MGVGAGGGAGDPLGLTARGGDATVEGHGGLEGDEGGTADDPMVEGLVEAGGGVALRTEANLEARAAQQFETASGVAGVGVGGGDDDALEAGGDEGVGAGGGTAVSGTGFEGDVEGGAVGALAATAGVVEGDDFGVGTAGVLMPALADDASVFDEDGADHGIG